MYRKTNYIANPSFRLKRGVRENSIRLRTFILLIGLFIVRTGYSLDTRSDSIDIKNIKLDLSFANFSAKTLYGKTTLSIESKLQNVVGIDLDLLKLTVDSVLFNNQQISFSYNDSVIGIRFPQSLNIHQNATIQVCYHGTPYQNPADFGGFYWNATYAFNIGVSFLANPPNYGKVWFPCFDNFVERSKFQFSITTDSTQAAFCNGILDSSSTNGNTKLWHWSLHEEIPSYLAGIAVSDYQTLSDTVIGANGVIPIRLIARASDTTRLKNSFVHLKDAFHIFEKKFGPYRFEKIGYVVVPFNAGAMEHATNIAYMQALVNGYTQYESTMAHELSHHWFGDLATCETAGDMWLNEGWARYCEAIFLENLYNKERANQDLRKSHEGVLRLAHIEDNDYWSVANIPHQYTYARQSIYEHGSLATHTLRTYMGDSLFFHCVTAYLNTYSFTNVNSNTLKTFLSQCSGIDLSDFFNDWVFSSGYADFSIADKRIKELGAGNFEVAVNIVQQLNNAPHLYKNVPIEISFFDEFGQREVRAVKVSNACSPFSFYLGFAPVFIALDYDEKLEDAITDEVRYVKSSGTYDFGTAKIILNPKSGTDSSLTRIEHHWVSPVPTGAVPAGYKLSDYRYWTVDGIWKDDFATDAKVNYNGSASLANGYLDNTFLNVSEDSLVVLYRENRNNIWSLADSFSLTTLSSKTDKIGSITIYNLQRGDYTLAIKDPSITSEIIPTALCYPLSIEDDIAETPGFEVYPNPLNADELNVEMSKTDYFSQCSIYDFLGMKVVERDIKPNQQRFMVPLQGLPKGVYIINLKNRKGITTSQKIIKTH